MTKPPSDLAKRVTKLRTIGGVSARELGRLADVSPSLLGQLERGEFVGLGAETALRVAAVLGVTPDLLVHGVGDWPSAEHVQGAVRAAAILRPRESKGAKAARGGKAAA